jgi:phosphatidate cytidylyltransferase
MLWTVAIASEWRKIREAVVKTKIRTSPFDRVRGSECACWIMLIGTACLRPKVFECVCLIIVMLLASCHLISLSRIEKKKRKDDAGIVRDAAISLIVDIFGLMYVPWCMSYFVRLSDLNLLIIMLWASFQCDTGALLAGWAFGKHRVVPIVSPGKTWEGYVGGMFLSSLSVSLLFLARPYLEDNGFGDVVPSTLSFSKCLILDFVAVCGSIFGDLFESLLKRVANIKDSGALLPGHGGALDRADSLLLTAPLFYYVHQTF